MTARYRYIYHISDLHIKNVPNIGENRGHRFVKSAEKFFAHLREQPADELAKSICVVAGDVFHYKNYVCPNDMSNALLFFTTLTRYVRTIVTIGNHDYNQNNLKDADLIEHLAVAMQNNPNFVYYKYSGEYLCDNICFTHISIFDGGSNVFPRQRPTTLPPNVEYNIAILHNEVAGVRYGKHLVNDTVVPPFAKMDYLRTFDYVLLGHIHDMQHIDTGTSSCRMAYCGAFWQQNVTERREKGALKWDLRSGGATFINLADHEYSVSVRMCNNILRTPLDSVDAEKITDITLYAECCEPAAIEAVRDQICKLTGGRIQPRLRIKRGIKKQIAVDKSIVDIATHEALIREFHYDAGVIDELIALHRKYWATCSKYDENALTRIAPKWCVQSLAWSNLMCYGANNYIDFTTMQDGIIGLIAPNKQGKSSLIDILLFGLFGTFRRGNAAKIINARSKTYCVIVKLLINDRTYYITRHGNIKRPLGDCGFYTVSLYSHNDASTDASSLISVKYRYGADVGDTTGNAAETAAKIKTDSRETNEIIKSYIGDYTTFCRTTYSTSEDNSEDFLTMTPTIKKTFLQNVFKYDVFDNIFRSVKDRIDTLNKEMKIRGASSSVKKTVDALSADIVRNADELRKNNEEMVAYSERYAKYLIAVRSLNPTQPEDPHINREETMLEENAAKSAFEFARGQCAAFNNEFETASLTHQLQIAKNMLTHHTSRINRSVLDKGSDISDDKINAEMTTISSQFGNISATTVVEAQYYELCAEHAKLSTIAEPSAPAFADQFANMSSEAITRIIEQSASDHVDIAQLNIAELLALKRPEVTLCMPTPDELSQAKHTVQTIKSEYPNIERTLAQTRAQFDVYVDADVSANVDTDITPTVRDFTTELASAMNERNVCAERIEALKTALKAKKQTVCEIALLSNREAATKVLHFNDHCAFCQNNKKLLFPRLDEHTETIARLEKSLQTAIEAGEKASINYDMIVRARDEYNIRNEVVIRRQRHTELATLIDKLSELACNLEEAEQIIANASINTSAITDARDYNSRINARIFALQAVQYREYQEAMTRFADARAKLTDVSAAISHCKKQRDWTSRYAFLQELRDSREAQRMVSAFSSFIEAHDRIIRCNGLLAQYDAWKVKHDKYLRDKSYQQKLHDIHEDIITQQKRIVAAGSTLDAEKIRLADELAAARELDAKLQEIATEKKILSVYLKIVDPKTGIQMKIMQNLLHDMNSYLAELAQQYANFTPIMSIADDAIIVEALDHVTGDRVEMGLTSGYQKFIFNVFFRLALLKFSTVGETSMFIIDEGFGCLDAENIARACDVLKDLSTNFDLILIVSHIDAMMSAVTHQVMIERDEHFSRIKHPRDAALHDIVDSGLWNMISRDVKEYDDITAIETVDNVEKRTRKRTAVTAADPSNNPFRCALCDINLATKKKYDAHVNTQKHKSREKLQDVADAGVVANNNPLAAMEAAGAGVFYCDTCKTHLKTPASLRKHMTTKSHLDKIKK